MTATPAKPLAFSYIRMSSAKQLKGHSFERQAEASRKYAEEHGLQLVEDFKLDLGVSAFRSTNLKEGALGKFLEECKSGEIPKGSYLLVESLDRLSRDQVRKALTLWNQIIDLGITIVTLVDRKAYNQSGDLIDIYYALGVMARSWDESKTKSERLTQKWAKRRADAIKDNVKISAQCPGWLKLSKDRKSYLEIPEPVKVLRRIFDDYVSGKGSKIITKELNLEGVPPFGRGKNWSEAYITKILSSRTVLGEFQNHKMVDGKRVPVDDPIPNYFPNVIDEETFNRAQSARRMRAIHGGGRRGEAQSNLFTYICHCGYCGSKMRHRSKGSRVKGNPPHRYLFCNARFNGSGCTCKPWPYLKFETSFLNFVREIDLRGLAGGAKKKSQLLTLNETIVAKRETLLNLNERMQNWLGQIEAEPDLMSILLARIKSLKVEADSVEAEIESLSSQIHSLQNDAEEISDAEMQELMSLFQSDDAANRMRLAERIKSLIERIDMFPNGHRSKFDEAMKIVESSEASDREEIAAYLSKGQDGSFRAKPHFVITFRDGSVQIVVPDSENPERLIVNAVAGTNVGILETEDPLSFMKYESQ